MGIECHDCRSRDLDRIAETVKGSDWWTARELLDTLDLFSDWVPFMLEHKVKVDREGAIKSLGRYLSRHKQNDACDRTLILETWESGSRATYYRFQPFHLSKHTGGVSSDG